MVQTTKAAYWEDRYNNSDTPWDVGTATPAILNYFKQVPNPSIKILIPGAGYGHEAMALYKMGFTNTFLLDFSPAAIQKFKATYPSFPKEQVLLDDFFLHQGTYNFIVEQTFFCALPPALRTDYVTKCQNLLTDNGKLVGVLFSVPLNEDHPPYGGNKQEYLRLFNPFNILKMENNIDAIKPRAGRELFILLQKTA